MTALPEIPHAGVRYRFPLTSQAAAGLCAALLAPSPAERRAWLRTALAVDAPLALWCALKGPQELSGSSNQAEALADWLAPRLAEELSAAVDPPDSASTVSPAEISRLLARDMQPAAAQKSAASGPTDQRHDPFLALLTGALDWLTLCGTPTPDPAQARAALPAWLANNLIAPTIGRESAANQPSLGAAAEQDRSASALACDVCQLVAPLAAQTARLQILETKFAAALEHAKLEALKEFAYGAGHEINNPLANISARAQTLLKDETDPDRRQKLAAINSQAFRAHEMIADLMLFARPPALKRQRIDVAAFLSGLAATWQTAAAGQQTTVDVQLPALPLAVDADPNALALALRALVTNALEALGRGGRIEVSARLVTSGPHAAIGGSHNANGAGLAGRVAIEVSDNGPGIPPDIRAKIFDPYFSGREAGRGLGFGLPKCWRIITAHGGAMEVASDVGSGSKFSLYLPLAESNAVTPAASAGP